MTNQREPGIRVLLIEQDAGFARYLGEMLRQAHELRAELTVAGDLRAGLAGLRIGSFDAVVVDLCIPDGAGLANVPLLQIFSPAAPVLVVGDVADKQLAVEVMQAGAQDYLVKSQITPGWIEQALRHAIERQRIGSVASEAEESYHSIFDHLVEGIFRTTPDGHYLMANPALARIYGYESPRDLIENLTNIAKSLYVQPGRRDEFVRRMHENDTLSEFESEVYRKDGSPIWISENCRAIRSPAGEVLYFEGTVEDITARRQAEENVRNSEALYHSLVETLPQNIFRKDLEGRFTFGNQQFCRVLGRTLEEIVGRTDFDFFPRELAAGYQRDDRRVIGTGKVFEVVEEHQPPTGGKIYVHVVKTPLRDAGGRIIGLQGIFWDITKEKRAEERIRQQHEEMEKDLSMAGDIQLAMLPQRYPVFAPDTAPGGAFNFARFYEPVSRVGGDFFTVFAITPDEAGVLICDVAGHGVRAGLITAMIRPLVEELKPLTPDPGSFLTRINHDLHAMLTHERSTATLTTAFYLAADARTGRLRYANAGHPKPLLLGRARRMVEPLANTGGKGQFPLGLQKETTYLTSEARLEPGDGVLLFTDGLYELQNRKEVFYTYEKLMNDTRRRLAKPADRLVPELAAAVRRFSGGIGFQDDVCVVGLDFAGGGAPGGAP